jgi:hypothetical protein
MTARSVARFGGLAAIVGGVFFALALPLVATQATDDPVGLRYDDFNRWLTLPLALLVVALAAVRSVQGARLEGPWRWGAWIALGGAALAVVGNVAEFWLVFFTDEYVSAIREDRPELDEWAGSTIGWFTVLAGLVLLFAGGLLFGAATWRAGVLPAWVGVAVAATSPLLFLAFILWARSVPATIAVALVLGLTWIAVGLRLRAGPHDKPREAVVS